MTGSRTPAEATDLDLIRTFMTDTAFLWRRVEDIDMSPHLLEIVQGDHGLTLHGEPVDIRFGLGFIAASHELRTKHLEVGEEIDDILRSSVRPVSTNPELVPAPTISRIRNLYVSLYNELSALKDDPERQQALIAAKFGVNLREEPSVNHEVVDGDVVVIDRQGDDAATIMTAAQKDPLEIHGVVDGQGMIVKDDGKNAFPGTVDVAHAPAVTPSPAAVIEKESSQDKTFGLLKDAFPKGHPLHRNPFLWTHVNDMGLMPRTKNLLLNGVPGFLTDIKNPYPLDHPLNGHEINFGMFLLAYEPERLMSMRRGIPNFGRKTQNEVVELICSSLGFDNNDQYESVAGVTRDHIKAHINAIDALDDDVAAQKRYIAGLYGVRLDANLEPIPEDDACRADGLPPDWDDAETARSFTTGVALLSGDIGIDTLTERKIVAETEEASSKIDRPLIECVGFEMTGESGGFSDIIMPELDEEDTSLVRVSVPVKLLTTHDDFILDAVIFKSLGGLKNEFAKAAAAGMRDYVGIVRIKDNKQRMSALVGYGNDGGFPDFNGDGVSVKLVVDIDSLGLTPSFVGGALRSQKIHDQFQAIVSGALNRHLEGVEEKLMIAAGLIEVMPKNKGDTGAPPAPEA